MKWLDGCLTSLLSQELPQSIELEIVVVDNGSSDQSIDLIMNNYPSVMVHALDTNAGFAVGCNVGVERSHGDLILLLNNDTITPKGMIKCLLDEFNTRGLDVVAAIEVPYSGGAPRLTRTTIDVTGFPVYLYIDEKHSDEPSFFLNGVCVLTSSIIRSYWPRPSRR